MKKIKKIIISEDCPTCNILKENGMCKDNECSELSTEEAQKMTQEASVKVIPQEICWSERKQKWVKCGNYKKLEKKYKKHKKL